MPSTHEIVSEQFFEWERRGRGWKVWPTPVFPEPPFRPFQIRPPKPAEVDDGRRATFLSSLTRKLSQKIATPTPPVVAPQETEEEPEPEILERDSLVELQTSLPAELDITDESFEQFLLNLSLCREPIAFELLGSSEQISAQFTAHPKDAAVLQRQLQAHFPEAVFTPQENALQTAWDAAASKTAMIEFGLERAFMYPLATGQLDSFVGIIGVLSELLPGELGLFQVMFQRTRQPWSESIMRSVTDERGKPFFVNAPDLTHATKEKLSYPLFAVVARIATKAEDAARVWEIARDLAASLSVFASPGGNELIPLRNDEYPFADHQEDVLRRQCRRNGMILNTAELTGLVHLPSSSVRTPKLNRQIHKSKAAPVLVQERAGLLLGMNNHAGRAVEVRLNAEQRVRHTFVIGASGTGKSNFMFNLIRQDLENGQGLAVLDPHGDLIEKILGCIPENRIQDVVLIDPSDEQYSVGFNILAAHSELEKNLLASDLVAVFQRLSTSWGDQMGTVLNNAILAFLESQKGGTLADLRRFLIEPDFRNDFLKTVTDSEVIYYWKKAFPLLAGNKSVGPVITRLEGFLSRKPIRYMVTQKENRIDFAEIMNRGKIFLAKLPQGQIGNENAYLLGSFFVSKFQQTAMSRQAQDVATRRDFWLYIDEFHNFITPSMAQILTGARKYRLGMILAHQELRQLQRDSEVASAVLANPYTRVCFRVGDDDAKKLAEGFASFETKDIQNLPNFQAICRVERADCDFNLSVPAPVEFDATKAAEIRNRVVTASREKFAVSRKQLDAEQAAKTAESTAESPPPPKKEPKLTSKSTEPSPIPPETQKVSEVPQIEVAPPASVSSEPKAEEAPRDLGRGKELHIAIQKRIQDEARKLGFSAQAEHGVSKGSNEAADVVISRDEFVMAVEVSVTTSISDEFSNVKKCLKSGFKRIAVLSTEPQWLEKFSAAARAAFGPEISANILCFSPDDFISELRKIAEQRSPPLPKTPGEHIAHGYRVRTHAPEAQTEEDKAQERTGMDVIAETLKRNAGRTKKKKP